jgi:hypothetical protein
MLDSPGRGNSQRDQHRQGEHDSADQGPIGARWEASTASAPDRRWPPRYARRETGGRRRLVQVAHRRLPHPGSWYPVQHDPPRPGAPSGSGRTSLHQGRPANRAAGPKQGASHPSGPGGLLALRRLATYTAVRAGGIGRVLAHNSSISYPPTRPLRRAATAPPAGPAPWPTQASGRPSPLSTSSGPRIRNCTRHQLQYLLNVTRFAASALSAPEVPLKWPA